MVNGKGWYKNDEWRMTKAVWATRAGASRTGKCSTTIKNERTKYPLPSHILSYSETSPKERECCNEKWDEQRTKNERTKDEQWVVFQWVYSGSTVALQWLYNEQKTVRAARANEQRTNKRRTMNGEWMEIRWK